MWCLIELFRSLCSVLADVNGKAPGKLPKLSVLQSPLRKSAILPTTAGSMRLASNTQRPVVCTPSRVHPSSLRHYVAGRDTRKHSLFCDCRSRQHQPDAAFLSWLCLQRRDQSSKAKLRYQFSLFYFVRLFKNCMDKAARRPCLSLGPAEQTQHVGLDGRSAEPSEPTATVPSRRGHRGDDIDIRMTNLANQILNGIFQNVCRGNLVPCSVQSHE